MAEDEVIPLSSNHIAVGRVRGSSSISPWPHLQLITSSWKCSRLLDLPRLLRLKSYWAGSKLLRLKGKQAVMSDCRRKRQNWSITPAQPLDDWFPPTNQSTDHRKAAAKTAADSEKGRGGRDAWSLSAQWMLAHVPVSGCATLAHMMQPFLRGLVSTHLGEISHPAAPPNTNFYWL